MKAGCQWRQLPKDFPNWKTVYSFFIRMQRRNIWEKIMNAIVMKSRENIINLDESSIAIDSQSVKTNGQFKKKAFMGIKE